MRTCENCNNRSRDEAKHCPHCGKKLPEGTAGDTLLVCVFVAAIFVLFPALPWVFRLLGWPL